MCGMLARMIVDLDTFNLTLDPCIALTATAWCKT